MSSRSLNKVTLIGNVGEEPRMTSTSNGTPVCSFSVATNRSWLPRGAKERKEETQWHYLVAFSKLAEVCSQILAKGTKVFIIGRVQSREKINPQGEAFRRTEIVVSDLIVLEKKKEKLEVI